MADRFDKYIDQYKKYLNEDRLDPMSFRDEESKEAFNEGVARETFGSERVDKLIKRNTYYRIFSGDLWQYAFLVELLVDEGTALGKNAMSVWNQYWNKEHAHVCTSYQIHLEHANLASIDFTRAFLDKVHLEGSNLIEACLQQANLVGVHLENALLFNASFKEARLIEAHAEKANLFKAHLEYADLSGAHLEGTYLKLSYLENMQCDGILIDAMTNFKDAKINSQTHFANTNLNMVVDDKSRNEMRYSARRLNWEDTYKKKYWRSSFIRLFWYCSDYGYSTKRIISSFLSLAGAFAAIYWLAGAIPIWAGAEHANAGIIENLFSVGGQSVGWFDSISRSIYFSIVTMTTLGFGDIYAKPESFWGYFFLTTQVILGYVLLGVLITRLAVLFNSDGPTYRPPESPTHPKFWPQFWKGIYDIPGCIKDLWKSRKEIQKAELAARDE